MVLQKLKDLSLHRKYSQLSVEFVVQISSKYLYLDTTSTSSLHIDRGVHEMLLVGIEVLLEKKYFTIEKLRYELMDSLYALSVGHTVDGFWGS